MNDYNFKINLKNIENQEGFQDGTKEELKILLYLVSKNGKSEQNKICDVLGVSKARVSSTITLFEESGVLVKCDEAKIDGQTLKEKDRLSYKLEPDFSNEKDNLSYKLEPDFSNEKDRLSYKLEPHFSNEKDNIHYEFEPNILNDDLCEQESKIAAENIRDGKLKDLFEECSVLMGRPALNVQEIKYIEAIYSKLALSPEYIVTLAAHLAKISSLTPKRLADESERLINSGITTLEELENYIKEIESKSSLELEFRKLFGIFGRTLTTTEKKYFKRWGEEFGFSTSIVGEAYDITVNNTGKRAFSYMNKLLTIWYENGCKTVEDCRNFVEKDREKMKAEKEKKNKKKKAEEAKQPKFTGFSSEEAMMNALARSYGNSDEDKK